MTSISKPPDYYEILQVSPNADIKSIKSSWKRLALARHPDKNTAKNAVAEFQLLHEAYSILIDPSTRQTYDAKYQASTSTSAQYSTSQTSRKTPDKDGEQKSIQELQSMLHRCEKDIRDHELRLKEAHASLMKLRAEITSLENDARSMEQDKASGQTIWGYLTSFLPGGESRLEQEREERDRIYRGKLATRRIKETEKSRRLEKIQAYEVFARAYRQQAISIEKKITEKREKDRRDYEELVKQMAEQRREYRTQAQQRRPEPPNTTICNHRAWWGRVEGRFRCSCCMIETRRFALQCPGCDKIACAGCQDDLRRKTYET